MLILKMKKRVLKIFKLKRFKKSLNSISNELLNAIC